MIAAPRSERTSRLAQVAAPGCHESRDLDEYGRRITDAGGRMVVEKQAVPGVGELSLFEDPDGRVLGLWKQGPKQE